MKPRLLFLIIGVGFATVGASLYLYSTRAQNPDGALIASSSEELVVSPQEARTSVTISRVTLAKDGYVVVRGSDGKRLGQIIEISAFLAPGTYDNIQIPLGDFYSYNEADRLIAMIYYDDGDRTFNDLDQPSSGQTAVFAKTGERVPASVFQEYVATSGGTGMETVRYTNAGFQPAKLTVPVGTMVEFVNQSDKTMWVASNVHPEHEILPTFDQFREVGRGERYMYTFDTKGTWPYHDHINPALEGVIVVQ